MIDETNQHIDFRSMRDVLTILFKHKYKILIAFLIISAVGVIVSSQVREIYTAKSVLLIKLGREFVSRPEVLGNAPSPIPVDSVARSELSILGSHDLMDKVVASIGPTTLYPALNDVPAGIARDSQALGSFERNLKISMIGPTVIEVKFANENPNVAAQAVNMLVDAFKDKHLEIFGGKSTEFLEGKEKAFREKLRESESQLAGFVGKNRIYSVPEQGSTLIQQQSVLETNLEKAQNKVLELEQKIAFIQSPDWAAEIPVEARTQLASLRQRERELLKNRTETSKPVQDLRQEIQYVEESLAKDSQDQRQMELRKTKGELSMARAEVAGARRQLEQAGETLNALERRSVEMNALKRQVAQEEENYTTYARKVEESLISDDMDRRKMVAISVIEKAVPTTTPQSGRLSKEELTGGGLVGGIAGGIILALLLEFLGPGMTTPLSAQRRLDLPVLVAIARKV